MRGGDISLHLGASPGTRDLPHHSQQRRYDGYGSAPCAERRPPGRNAALGGENARFRDEHPDESTRMEAEARAQVECERLQAEADQLRRLYEQAIGDLQEERTQTGEAKAELAGAAAERY